MSLLGEAKVIDQSRYISNNIFYIKRSVDLGAYLCVPTVKDILAALESTFQLCIFALNPPILLPPNPLIIKSSLFHSLIRPLKVRVRISPNSIAVFGQAVGRQSEHSPCLLSGLAPYPQMSQRQCVEGKTLMCHPYFNTLCLHVFLAVYSAVYKYITVEIDAAGVHETNTFSEADFLYTTLTTF